MAFVFAETPGMYGAAAAHEALALETGGAGGAQAAAAGCVVPPGLDEGPSPMNAAKIAAYSAHVAATMAMAAGYHGMYGGAVAASGMMFDLGDADVDTTFGTIAV
ncbi:MAG: hypothetical protein JOZ49_21975 [Mycolicibacterium sp.]|nr:hypothetical protein [Mycolicibacterium sp.]